MRSKGNESFESGMPLEKGKLRKLKYGRKKLSNEK